MGLDNPGLFQRGLYKSGLFAHGLWITLKSIFDRLQELDQPMVVAYEGQDSATTGHWPLPGAVVLMDGIDGAILAPHLVGTETVVSSYGTTPVVTAGRIDFALAGNAGNIVLSDGTIYQLSDTVGLKCFDASGQGNDGTLDGGTTRTIDNAKPIDGDFDNLNGWTLGTGINGGDVDAIIPADPTNKGFDVKANALDFEGSVYPVQPIREGSYALVGDGIVVLQAAWITGKTVVSWSGTSATVAVSGDTITMTAGTVSNILMSDGTLLPCAEGVGDTITDISGNSNHATIIGGTTGTEGAGTWAGRIDGLANASNLTKGFSRRMLFDGVDDEVNLGNSTDFDSTNDIDITFEALIDDNGAAHQFIGKGTGNTTNWNIDYSSAVRFFGYSSTVVKGITAGTPTLTNNTKTLVRCTFDGTTWKVYYDGVEVKSLVDAATLTPNTDDVVVGLRGAVALSGTLYNLAINGTAYYEGYGNTDADWTDQIGSNDGTVNGSPALLRLPASVVDPTVDALLGDPLTNPPVLHPGGQYGHNDAETTEDGFNVSEAGTPVVGTSNLTNFSTITFDDSNSHLISIAPIDAVYRRASSTISRDRLIAFYDTLTGTDKTLALKYTEGSAWDDLVIWDDTEEWAD